MALINVSNLTFAHDGSYRNVFEDVSFQIDTTWRLGFVGRNGRGKTTFLKLLLGCYEYRGTISSNIAYKYFPYEVNSVENFTIDIIHGITPNTQDWQIQRELSLLDVADEILYRQFFTLSKGEQTKVLVAAMFLNSDNFLLIDEPTNHLDTLARKKLSDYLKTKSGFILVSHDRDFLDNCVDHILSINKQNIEVQKGDFSSWWENKKLQDTFELNEDIKLKKEIKHLTNAAKRTATWSEKVEKTKKGSSGVNKVLDKGYVGHKAAKMMKRSKSLENRQNTLISEKSKLLKNIEETSPLKILPLKYHSQTLAELHKISISYNDKVVCSDINFAINNGDKIALIGKNGCGKSSILKLIVGEKISHDGNLKIPNNLIISHVPQSTDGLSGNLTVYAMANGIDESLFKSILRKLDFSREQFDMGIETFSAGQKKKVLIARSLCERAHLYIWDEPLNYIDVLSRIQIEQLLQEYNPTILFVEHDKRFCENIATKTVQL